jgi:hypothetical protein
MIAMTRTFTTIQKYAFSFALLFLADSPEVLPAKRPPAKVAPQ